MKEKINETVLSILKKNSASDNIEISYIDIVDSLSPTIQKICRLCDSPSTNIDTITIFILTTPELGQLDGQYKYCESLGAPYQGFNVRRVDFVKDIDNRKDLIFLNKKKDPEGYDDVKNLNSLKQDIRRKYLLWSHPLAIEKAYSICKSNKEVIIFSHRSSGWSNPVYTLTPNFSIEIKTNFGYGSVSYFYTKMKYKNIEITPFSEWVVYEFANFAEIIRYTSSHRLKNEFWLEAMEFSKNACNLSMTDEVKFVETYVIEECEIMVSGLEDLFDKSHFTFKNREKIIYHVDKTGHILMEFRGEKISGALDFISQIREFQGITNILSFIDRIEKCNRKIHAGLLDELKVIKIKIKSLTKEIYDFKPKYDKVVSKNNSYIKYKKNLQSEMIKSGKLENDKIDLNKLNQEFNFRYPEYRNFEQEYKVIIESFRKMNEALQNMTTIYNKIVSHVGKIDAYFSMKSNT